MSRKKKVCLITNRYPAYSDDVASPFVRDFHLGLEKRGIRTSIFTPYYETPRTEWEDQMTRFRWAGGKKVVGALSPFNPKELLHLLSFIRQGKRQLLLHLQNTQPDECLALWALPSGWFALQAKRKLGIPYSVWCLGSDIYVWAKRPVLGSLTRKVLQEADHLFADGLDLCERVRKLSGKECRFLPSMRKLPQVVDPNKVVDSATFNFLYVGRWEKKKGLDDLIRAFGQVQQRIRSTRLYLLGWGEFENGLRRLINGLKLGDNVKVVGRVPTPSVANYLRQADCLVIPSKGDSIPLVFSEALQAGTPLIVSDVGDMGRLVREFDLGRVVPPGDVQELSRAMIGFRLDKKDYTRNIPEALKLFDPDKAVDDYLNTIAGRTHHQFQTADVLK
jgi:glycosyltransferase involved in cell wall biosynthesis